jgi:glycosyltransferase involved in cell wall biosynthesis
MTQPSVSIIVPVYNGARFIAEALASVQSEPGIEAEIIVVDDGSTDRSAEIVASIAERDPRIRLYLCEHRGVSATRNVGVKAATGDYVTFVDSDDICPPGRIKRQVGKLASRPDVVAVIGETMLFEAMTPELQPAPGSRHMRMLLVTLHSALFHRNVFEKFGLFDETLACSEDMDFFLRLAEVDAPLLVETEIASFYRRHPGNMTANGREVRIATLAALQRSCARRRATGRSQPLDLFFTRRLAAETIFGGDVSPPEAALTDNGCHEDR